MSNTTIKDGKGTGTSARVDSLNRLSTVSTAVDEFAFYAARSQSYIITSGIITLTSASISALLYIKNIGDNDIVVSNFRFWNGTSTGGSGDIRPITWFNPTAGTLISGGSTGSSVNVKVGDASQLEATILAGSEGSTITAHSGQVVVPTNVESPELDIPFHIPKGSSMAFGFTPPSDNTSLDVLITIRAYVREEI